MVRLATVRDIPQLARLWYAEKAKTCFSQLQVDWSIDGCAMFLSEIIDNPFYSIHVIDQDGQIQAVCGVVVYQDLLPPHPTVVAEWMWFGKDKRSIVKVLHNATTWGQSKGATLLRYTLNQAGKSPTQFTETYQWRVL